MELETVDNPVALIHLEELDALRNESHRLKEEVASLGLKVENGQLREENLRLKFELQAVQLKDEIQRLRDENLQLREDNGRLKEEVGQLKTENAKLRAENLRLEGESLALGRVQTARVSTSQDKCASQKHSPVIHSTAPSSAHRGWRTRSSQRLDSKQGSNNDLDVGKDGLLRGITVFARGENDDNAGDDFEDANPEELSIGSDGGGSDTIFNSDVAAGGLNITVSETMDMRDAIMKQESGWGGEATDMSVQEESVQPEGVGKGKRGGRTGENTRGKRRESERAAAITQPSTSESQMDESAVSGSNYESVSDRPWLCMCVECGKTYRHQTTLSYHRRLVHCSEGGPKYKCDVCQKAFMRPAGLADHMNVEHLKRKPYQCADCHKSFGSKHNASPRRHCCKMNPSTFVCKVCSKQFGHRTYLKEHLVTHSNTPRYSCANCYQHFQYRSQLGRHRTKCLA